MYYECMAEINKTLPLPLQVVASLCKLLQKRETSKQSSPEQVKIEIIAKNVTKQDRLPVKLL